MEDFWKSPVNIELNTPLAKGPGSRAIQEKFTTLQKKILEPATISRFSQSREVSLIMDAKDPPAISKPLAAVEATPVPKASSSTGTYLSRLKCHVKSDTHSIQHLSFISSIHRSGHRSHCRDSRKLTDVVFLPRFTPFWICHRLHTRRKLLFAHYFVRMLGQDALGNESPVYGGIDGFVLAYGSSFYGLLLLTPATLNMKSSIPENVLKRALIHNAVGREAYHKPSHIRKLSVTANRVL